MPVSFPNVGFQFVILGMAAARQNAKSITDITNGVGRSMFLFERNVNQAGLSVGKVNDKIAQSIEKVATQQQRLASIGTAAYATVADAARAEMLVEVASAREAAAVRADIIKKSLTSELAAINGRLGARVRAAKAETEAVRQEQDVAVRDAVRAADNIREADARNRRLELEATRAGVRERVANAQGTGTAEDVAAARATGAAELVAAREADRELARVSQQRFQDQTNLAKGFSAAQIQIAQDRERQVVEAAKLEADGERVAARDGAAARVASSRAVRDAEIENARLRRDATVKLDAEQTKLAEAEAARRAEINKLIIGGTIAAIAATAAAFGAATIAAAKYEKELVNVAAIAQLTPAGFKALNDEIFRLGANSTNSVNDLVKGAGELVKAGLDVKTVIQDDGALQAVNDLTIAANGELGLADAATSVAIALNAFKKSGVSATQVATALNAAVQGSALTFSGAANAVKQGAGVLANAGFTLQETFATFATIGRTQPNGSEVGTGARRLITQLQSPSVKQKKLLDDLKISLTDTNHQLLSATDLLTELENKLGDTAVATGAFTKAQQNEYVQTLFGERAGKAFFALLSNEGLKAWKDNVAAASDNAAFMEVVNAQLLTSAAQWKIFTNNVEIAAVQVGTALLPQLNQLTKNLLGMAQAFPTSAAANFARAILTVVGAVANVLGAIKDFIAGQTALQAAIAGVVGAIVISYIPAWAAAAQVMLQQTAAAIAITIGRFAGLRVAALGTAGALGPLGFVMGAIAALWVAKSDEITQSFADLTALIGNGLVQIGQALSEANQGAGNAIIEKGQALKEFGIALHGEVERQRADAAKQKKDLDDLLEKTKKSFDLSASGAEPGFEEDVHKIDQETKKVKEIFSDLGLSLAEVQRKAGEKIQDIANDTNAKLADAAREAQRDIVDAQRKASQEAADLVNTDAAKTAADNRKRTLELIQSAEELARKQSVEHDDAAFKQRLENQDAFNKELLKLQEDAFKQGQDVEQTNRKLVQEADDAIFQKAQEHATDALKRRQDAEDQALKDRQSRILEDQKFQDELVTREADRKLELVRLEREFRDKIADITENLAKKRQDAAHDEEVRHAIAIRNAKSAAARAAEDARHAGKVTAIGQIGQDQITEATNDFNRRKAEALARQKEDQQTFENKHALDVKESTTRQQLDQQERDLKIRHENELQQLKDQQDAAGLARKQQNEVADFNFKVSQENALAAFKAQVDDQERAQKADRDAQELARKQQQEVDDAKFKQDQEAQRRQLDAQLDAEDQQRKLELINRERDERIRAITEALTEKQNKIREQAAQELIDLDRSVGDQLATIRKKYNDEITGTLSDVSASLQPMIEHLTDVFNHNFDSVKQSAIDAGSAIAAAFGQEQAFRAVLSQREFMRTRPTGGQPGTFAPGFAGGGVVPGRAGAPVLVVAHGGERFAGVHGERADLMRPSLGAAAQAARNAVTNITSTVSYSVEASYGRIQPEGSLLMDLRALAMMRR